MSSTSIVTYHEFNPEADSQPKTLDLAWLQIDDLIGGGLHGTVYSASYPGWPRFALKVFNCPPGSQLKSPFESELAAYKLILKDEQNRKKCPVVEAYGWFTLPENFLKPIRTQRTRLFNLTRDHQRNVLVKKLLGKEIGTLPWFHNSSSTSPHTSRPKSNLHPDEVLENFSVLIALGINIPDLNSENFLGGRILDMSSATIQEAGSDQQLIRLKRVVLEFNGWVLEGGMTDDQVESYWEGFCSMYSKKYSERIAGEEEG